MTANVQIDIETGTLPRKGGPALRTYSVKARVAPVAGADPLDTTRATGATREVHPTCDHAGPA